MNPGPEPDSFARELHTAERTNNGSSARNHLAGIVTVILGDVSARVEIQAGPFRAVSVISRDSADELTREPSVPALAVIKSTNVVIERP
jgi:molybdopterin-binding protein